MAAPVLQHFERPIPISVRGLVIDDLGDVVGGAAVNLLFGDRPIGRADSGSEGSFAMTDLELKLGIHKFRASRPGYRTSEETFAVTQDMSDSTRFVVLRLNPVGWDDASSDASRLRISSFEGEERRSKRQKYVTVDVFFATDRKFQNVRNVYQRFGDERSESDGLSYGVCQVSIPEGHRIGQIESPIFKLHFLEDPGRHVVLSAIENQSCETFFQSVSGVVRKSSNRDAFVFIHGYNVTFGEAVRRTAQIAFDLGFQGAPVCYSWPSSGAFSKYMADEAAVEWTTPHLSEFLKNLVSDTGANTVHLIAHSMGNRALARALESVDENVFHSTCRLRQIILAAPDIDRGVFIQVSGRISGLGERTTLYASSNDLPLAISQQFHAYPRAGEGGDNVLLVQGVDTVDASSVPSGFLGHSYYAGTRTVLTDLYELVKHGTAPPRFGFKALKKGDKTYWLLLP